MSFFSTVKHNFLEVGEDEKVLAKEFLDACDQIVPFFDALGSTKFAMVKKDINGNIAKLRNHLDPNNPALTLQDIVNKEIEANTTKAKNSATDALLWLKRALSFIRALFTETLTMEPDFVKIVNNAYEVSLKKYHGWMVQKLFGVALMAVPYRKDFIIALGKDVAEEQIMEEMKEALRLMGANLDAINKFYVETGQERTDKV